MIRRIRTATAQVVFEQNRAQVYAWAYRLVQNHHDALDVTQEVFIKWWRALAYAAVLLIGTGIGWIARPAENAPPQIEEPPAVQPGLPGYDRAPESMPPSRFVRNALALSSASTREPANRRGKHCTGRGRT